MSSDSRPATGPYRGLRPFGDSHLDALLFFGRERERAILVANLRAARLTVLYGPSGAGKTSLAQAGVVHELRALAEHDSRAGRVVVYDRWVGDPRAGLASAIEEVCGAVGPAAGLADVAASAGERVGGPLYLVLDQFEEYFVYHPAETLAADLPELVGRPGLDVHVLISLRDDSLSRLDVFKEAIPSLFSNVLRLDRLDRQGGRRAIVGPLGPYGELAGRSLTIEPELVERVLEEVAVGRLEPEAGTPAVPDEHGRIEAPYLQLVLERLWNEEARSGSDCLRLETLGRLGGAEAIVRDHLDNALASLDDRELDAAAAVLNQLVTPSGTKIAHRPADLAEYAHLSQPELGPVLATLGRQRILRTIEASGSEPERCEIFHDVLAGPVNAWRSGWAVERERRAAARQRRRLLFLSGGALLALAIVIGVAVFALVQRSHARADTRRAQARELSANALVELPVDGQSAVALALRATRLAPSEQGEDVLRQALLESHERSVVTLGGHVRVAAFDRSGRYILVASDDGRLRLVDRSGHRLLWAKHVPAPLADAFFMPDGRSVVAAGGSEVAVWNAADGRILRQLKLPEQVRSVAATVDERSQPLLLVGAGQEIQITPLGPAGGPVRHLSLPAAPFEIDASSDGSLLAVILEDAKGHQKAAVADLRSGRLLHVLPGLGVKSVAFSPDGRLLATGSSDRNARLWSPRSAKLLHVLLNNGRLAGRAIGSLDFSADGTRLATASTDGGVRVWNTATGARELLLVGPNGAMNSVRFSADGRFLITASSDRAARVYEADNGKELTTLSGHGDAVLTAAFSPDARLAVTGGSDGTARIWEPDVADQLRPIETTPDRPVRDASFSPDGTLLLVRRDSGLTVRDVRTNRLIARFGASGQKIVAASFSPDSRLVAVETSDGSVHKLLEGRRLNVVKSDAARGLAFAGGGRLLTIGAHEVDVWTFPGGRHLRTLPTGEAAQSVAAGRRGSIAATLTSGEVRLWNVETGSPLGHVTGPASLVAVSPDGRLLATSRGNDAFLWRTSDGRLLHRLTGHSGRVTQVVFSDDGSLLVTGSLDHDARVWSTSNGSLVSVLRGHFSPIYGVGVSPDDRWVVTAGLLTVGVWRSSTGLPLFFLRGPTAALAGVSFGADGSSILAGSQDGGAYLYRCDVCGNLADLEALAEQRLKSAPRTA